VTNLKKIKNKYCFMYEKKKKRNNNQENYHKIEKQNTQSRVENEQI